jgi:hypothetical protein
MYTLRPRRAIIDDEAGGGAWSMESMDGCFVGLYRCSSKCFCEVCGLWLFVAFCGFLWPFVAFCGVLWPFVAFCGFLWPFLWPIACVENLGSSGNLEKIKKSFAILGEYSVFRFVADNNQQQLCTAFFF